MNSPSKCTIVLENMDLRLLKQQKSRIIQMCAERNLSPYEIDVLDGMIALCDAIQDYAVDVLGLPENEVFNLTEE